jgi:hypothetical protein
MTRRFSLKNDASAPSVQPSSVLFFAPVLLSPVASGRNNAATASSSAGDGLGGGGMCFTARGSSDA